MNFNKFVAKATVPGRYLMVPRARIINRWKALQLLWGRKYVRRRKRKDG